MFYGTVHHDTIKYPPLIALDADTLTKAKIEATRRFGGGEGRDEYEIRIIQSGEIVSRRSVNTRKWANTEHA